MRRRGRWAIGIGAVGFIAALWMVVSIRRDQPVVYDDVVEHFKYGSIGSEPGVSLLRPVGGVLPPYAVFTALPSICPEKLPGGYASLGFLFEEGQTLPIGVARRRRIGIDHVGLNCAACHAGTLRDTPQSAPKIVLGMPAQQLDLQGFVEFVLECSLDSRTTSGAIRRHMADNDISVSLFERALLWFGLVDRLKDTTRALQNRIGPLLGPDAPRWGRGRVDTFNPYKALQFNWHLDTLTADEIAAASDFPSLWNQKPREGLQLHWDGNNDSVDERNLSAALGAGVTPVTVDHAGIKRVRDWIWTLPPPAYPYPIDAALADRGAGLYRQHCLTCHADHRFREGITDSAATRVGKVEDIDVIRTDRHRLDSYTDGFAASQYALYPDSEYRFTRFRKTRGYANHPLDGIWLRAPYLHNGSVPTLVDLLNDQAQRPKTFYRGYDVYDRARVGFVSRVAEEGGRTFSRYDTSLPGNGNGGHDYGTMLPADDKLALIEYMKRL